MFDNPQALLSSSTLVSVHAQLFLLGPQGATLYDQLILATKQGLVLGLHNVFVLTTLILCLGLITVFFLPEIELRTTTSSAVEPELDQSTEVVTATELH